MTTFAATRTFSADPVVRAPSRFGPTKAATARTETTGRVGRPITAPGRPRAIENSANANAYIAVEPT